MPLDEQEQRCATAVIGYLTEHTGRTWREGARAGTDDYESDGPSFDLRLTDGQEDLLVEITGLTDGPEFSRHDKSADSLFQRLAPDPDKSYGLYLPSPYMLRLDPRQVSQLKRGIKRAARRLGVGDKAPVAIHRRGILKFMREAVPGYPDYIACHHGDSWPLSEFSSEASGVYFLQDDWRYDHQFLTPERRSEFRRRLVRACSRSREKGQAIVEWQEEWELQRLKDPAEREGGVRVPGVVTDYTNLAAIQSVHQGLEHGKRKFHQDRDGAKVAVALHVGEHQHKLSLKQYEDAIASLSAADVWPLDTVFLVDGDRVHRCFNYDHINVSPPAI